MFQMLISLHSLAYQDSGDRDGYQVVMYPWKAASAPKGRNSEVVLEVSLGSFLLWFSLSLRVTREKELRSVLQKSTANVIYRYTQRLEDYFICKSTDIYLSWARDTAITALLFPVVPQECTLKSNLAFRLHIVIWGLESKGGLFRGL